MFSFAFYVVLVVAGALVLVVLSSRRRLPVNEIVLLVLIVATASLLGPWLLNELTNKRAAPDETAPWLTLVSFAGAFGWLYLRPRFLTAQQHSPKAKSPPAAAQPRARPAAAAKTPPAPQSAQAPRSQRIFISYRRADSTDVTGRIYDRLEKQFGQPQVHMDVNAFPLGVDFREHIDQLLASCDALIAIIGPRWLDAAGEDGERRLDDPADLVRLEVAAALNRGIAVIPVLVGGSTMPPEAGLPEELRALAYRNGIPVRSDPDFHNDMDRLIAGLQERFASRA